MKFRKRPVVIDAVQFKSWNGKGNPIFAGDPPGWLTDAMRDGVVRVSLGRPLEIVTFEGVMAASLGDWIIRGVKGEIYACKPDIFAATYEPAEDEAK